ncbi:MAG TPA: AbrB/MazE/SpoVT family DNA-binding domain-containing protein [Actinomycetota bacterium]|nr:AbrB/MazE/SpoVT family DNA-binding domain-containing protein [Actinomycetota bacterium]
MVTRLQKWGNSQGVRFPKTVLDEARLKVGDDVSLLVRGGKIIVEPARKVRRRFRLKALVSRMPHDHRPEELDWGGPVGRETW